MYDNSYFDIEGRYITKKSYVDSNKKAIMKVTIDYRGVETSLWMDDNFERLEDLKEGMLAIFRGSFDIVSFRDQDGNVKKFTAPFIKHVRVVDRDIYEAFFNR